MSRTFCSYITNEIHYQPHNMCFLLTNISYILINTLTKTIMSNETVAVSRTAKINNIFTKPVQNTDII
jgi:hypothetical protein